MASAGVGVRISVSEADIGGLMDVLYWRWMRLWSIVELWKIWSTQLSTVQRVMYRQSWHGAPGSCSLGSSGDVTLHLTFWPFNELQPKDSRVYALLGSGVTIACHVTCFSFLFKAWQILTIRSPVGLKPRLARHAAVCSASARHLTHFSFIPTSGAVCLDLTPRTCLHYSLWGCDTICDSCSSWKHHERRNINSSSIWCLKWCYRCSKKINPLFVYYLFFLYILISLHTHLIWPGDWIRKP